MAACLWCLSFSDRNRHCESHFWTVLILLNYCNLRWCWNSNCMTCLYTLLYVSLGFWHQVDFTYCYRSGVKTNIEFHSFVEFSSVRSLDQLGLQGELRDDWAEIFFQSFLQEAIVSCSGLGRDVHSLMLSIQNLLCWLWHHPPCKVP